MIPRAQWDGSEFSFFLSPVQFQTKPVQAHTSKSPKTRWISEGTPYNEEITFTRVRSATSPIEMNNAEVKEGRRRDTKSMEPGKSARENQYRTSNCRKAFYVLSPRSRQNAETNSQRN